LSYRSNSRDIFEHAVATTMRAIAYDNAVEMSITTGAPNVSSVQERVSRLPQKVHSIDVAEVRGTADSLALKHRYHDPDLHCKLMPGGTLARDIFDAIEEARIEALGARNMPGVRANLAALAQKRALKSGLSKRCDNSTSIVAAVLGLIVRERLTGDSPPDAARLTVESQRKSLALEQRVGHLIDSLIDTIENQKDLSLISLRIIAELVGDDLNSGYDDQNLDENIVTENQEFELPDVEASAVDNVVIIGNDDDIDKDNDNDSDNDIVINEIENDDAKPGEGNHQGTVPWRPNHALPPVLETPGYEIFTDTYDVVSKAEELCDIKELESLRGYLDQQMIDMSSAISKLANRLQRRLLAYQRTYWQFDLEEGVLDTERLSRIITNPQYPCSFKMKSDIEFKDTVVTLLLDNSGSMRGRPILITAIVADILTRTLERCGVKVEILGFTTNAWDGGQNFKAWLEAGKPRVPGRLNDLLHIIYKSADTPWRKARRNLGLIMQDGLLKENIDGEALLWAHNRLMRRTEERRILMVISDGAPVDDSTLTANSGDFLEKHLQQVIDRIETCSPVELNAIGIGHDVTRFYKSAETISDVNQLGSAMTERLTALFERVRPRPRMIAMNTRL
jgi:cobaltochelatase CobT